MLFSRAVLISAREPGAQKNRLRHRSAVSILLLLSTTRPAAGAIQWDCGDNAAGRGHATWQSTYLRCSHSPVRFHL